MDKMEICSPCPEIAERVMLDGGILREKLLLQVEPDIWMPVYLLIPPGSGRHSDCVLAPHGHQGAGKYSVAGCSEIPAVAEAIDRFHYGWDMLPSVPMPEALASGGIWLFRRMRKMHLCAEPVSIWPIWQSPLE